MQLASGLVKTLSHTVHYFFLVFDITFLCAFLIYLIEIRISSKYMDSSLFGFYVWCVKGINLHMYKYHDNNRSIFSLFSRSEWKINGNTFLLLLLEETQSCPTAVFFHDSHGQIL